jgi:hypothetical protein
MHAAPGALLAVERNIALNQARVQSVFLEFLLTPCASKKAPLIVSRFGLD